SRLTNLARHTESQLRGEGSRTKFPAILCRRLDVRQQSRSFSHWHQRRCSLRNPLNNICLNLHGNLLPRCCLTARRSLASITPLRLMSFKKLLPSTVCPRCALIWS